MDRTAAIVWVGSVCSVLRSWSTIFACRQCRAGFGGLPPCGRASAELGNQEEADSPAKLRSLRFKAPRTPAVSLCAVGNLNVD